MALILSDIPESSLGNAAGVGSLHTVAIKRNFLCSAQASLMRLPIIAASPPKN
jgi:hypothetical protein